MNKIYTQVCSVMRSDCPEISVSPGIDISDFQDPSKYGHQQPFCSKNGFKLKNFLSDCLRIWHVHGNGREACDGKQDRPSLIHWWPTQFGPLDSPIYRDACTFWLVYEVLAIQIESPWYVHMSRTFWWGQPFMTLSLAMVPLDFMYGPIRYPEKNEYTYFFSTKRLLSYDCYIWHVN